MLFVYQYTYCFLVYLEQSFIPLSGEGASGLMSNVQTKYITCNNAENYLNYNEMIHLSATATADNAI